jgi:hypothetical protein
MALFSRDPHEHWPKQHFPKNEVANSGYTTKRRGIAASLRRGRNREGSVPVSFKGSVPANFPRIQPLTAEQSSQDQADQIQAAARLPSRGDM